MWCGVCTFVCVCMHGCDSYHGCDSCVHRVIYVRESGTRNKKTSGRTREDVLFRSRSSRTAETG